MKPLLVVLSLLLGCVVARTAHGQEPPLVQLTSLGTVETGPSWSPDGTRIAIEVDLSSTSYIMVIPDTGGTGFPLMPATSRNGFPSWSADGTRIAFQSDRSGGGSVTLWTIPAAGGVATQLTFGFQDRDPAWSPEGSRIAFPSGKPPSSTMNVVPVTGGAPVPIHCCGDDAPSWSPDGTMIAFGFLDDIYVMPDTGGTANQLTFDSASDRYPSWSPDGIRIAFESDRNGNRDIWMVSAAGGNPVQLTYATASDRFPAWSPDGRRIAFSSDRGGTFDIWLMTVSPVANEPSTWGRLKTRYVGNQGSE